jgi:hypothetical protein
MGIEFYSKDPKFDQMIVLLRKIAVITDDVERRELAVKSLIKDRNSLHQELTTLIDPTWDYSKLTDCAVRDRALHMIGQHVMEGTNAGRGF